MGNVLDKGVEAIEGLLAYMAKHMIGRDLAGYCELATAVGLTEEDMNRWPEMRGPYILVTDAYSLLSVFEVHGAYQMLSDGDFAATIDNLRGRMNGYMGSGGHSLTMAFERDPDRALEELTRMAEPQLRTARRMGLKSEDVIMDRVRRNAPFVAWEQNLLIVYTHTDAMPADELKRELGALAKKAAEHRLPRTEYGQSPAMILMALKYRHDALLERLKTDLEKCGPEGRPGVMITPLGAHEAVRRVRHMVRREGGSSKYRPVLPGDRCVPSGREDARDASDLTAPLLGYQICSHDVLVKGGLIRTDNLWHGCLRMELGPQEPKPFPALFESISRAVPWRVRIDLGPKGLSELRARATLAGFVGMLPGNRQIRQAFLDLEERAKHELICSMKATFSTWSPSEHETKSRMAKLENAVHAWGSCQVTSCHGDPMAAWASTIPAFTRKNTANRMAPPLSDALGMMPWQRPATPWGDGGAMILRTPDGKIYPVQPGSRLQDTWIELLSSPPGSGKSVLLNSLNSAAIHRPGNRRLPLMTIIDVGPSSSGLISLIRDSLPDGRKSEAVYLRLQNSAEYAVNPFDTQLGARFPTFKETEFLTDLLTLCCADPVEKRAPGACARACRLLLEAVYKIKAEISPSLYESRVDPCVDAALDASGIRARHDAKWWESASWYETADLLFAAGYVREASMAQRYAVPTLNDCIACLQDETVRRLYGDVKIEHGQSLLGHMERCFQAAVNAFPLFGRTRFALDSATRVISVDLHDVIGAKSHEGSLKTAMMYMFARHLAAKNYFLNEETLLSVVPAAYVAYHKERIADIQDEQKIIAYDEFHNTGGQEAVVETVVKDGREGRKWGVRILLASQYLQDFPEALLNAATVVYVMQGNNHADEEILKRIFKINEEAVRRLRRDAVGPGPEGGNFLAMFKTKVGVIVQMLTNTVGPIELWAFSTTAEDAALRNRLYKMIGAYEARKLLAERFPLGSARSVIDHMRLESGENETESAIETLAKDLAGKFHAGSLYEGRERAA
jgi:intracellular multiplication protein IcmB